MLAQVLFTTETIAMGLNLPFQLSALPSSFHV
jgi:hypothetical protein